VVVSNLFGLPLLRFMSADAPRDVVEQVETLFAHVFFTASEMVDRLPVRPVESIITVWDDLVLLQTMAFPLTFAVVGDSSASLGLMQVAAEELRRVLEPVRRQAEEYNP
jgi:predicted regulator of Ras-like GTPase activity (Roadblock/LC7/MglB family)